MADQYYKLVQSGSQVQDILNRVPSSGIIITSDDIEELKQEISPSKVEYGSDGINVQNAKNETLFSIDEVSKREGSQVGLIKKSDLTRFVNHVESVASHLPSHTATTGTILTWDSATNRPKWGNMSEGGGVTVVTPADNKIVVNTLTGGVVKISHSTNYLHVPTWGSSTNSQVLMVNPGATSPTWGYMSSPQYTAGKHIQIVNNEISTYDVAELVNGKVPLSQLPPYIDYVVEGYYYEGSFYKDVDHTKIIIPEHGKIYVDLNTNKTYRWDGTAYVAISTSLELGTNHSNAYYGDLGNTAYQFSQNHNTATDAHAAIFNTKQNKLTAGNNITISTGNVISAIDTTYSPITTSAINRICVITSVST